MRLLTLFRDDFNNPIHGNLFDSLLEDLGIETHVVVAGRSINREIDEVTLTVAGVKEGCP